MSALIKQEQDDRSNQVAAGGLASLAPLRLEPLCRKLKRSLCQIRNNMPTKRKGKSNTYRSGRETIEFLRVNLIKRSVCFAAITGICVSVRIFYVDFIYHNKVSFQEAITNYILLFIAIFALVAIGLISGGKSNFSGDSNISPWFAWYISVSAIAFLIGFCLYDGLYSGGLRGVGMWTIAFTCVWSVYCHIPRKKA